MWRFNTLINWCEKNPRIFNQKKFPTHKLLLLLLLYGLPIRWLAEMMHCTFVESLQNGYDMVIFNIAFFRFLEIPTRSPSHVTFIRNFAIFSLYPANIKYGHSYKGRRIGNPRRSIEWCHFQWRWVTPNLDFKVTIFFNVK